MKPPLRHRLAAAWQALLGQTPPTPSADTAADDARLVAQAEAARERLRADEAAQQCAALRRELDAEKGNRDAAIQAALQTRLEPALADAASVIGQLALQSSLIEQGKPVTARDVMALATSLTRSFEKLGLLPLAKPGDAAQFNPDQHQPLGGFAPATGTPVTIKVPGCRLGPRIVRKSLVEPPPPAATAS